VLISIPNFYALNACARNACIDVCIRCMYVYMYICIHAHARARRLSICSFSLFLFSFDVAREKYLVASNNRGVTVPVNNISLRDMNQRLCCVSYIE
jgi:hypothetical protein